MKIKAIETGSIAEEIDLKPGDDLISINGNKIRDEIDFRFYASDEQVELLVKRDGYELFFEIEKDYDDLLGIHPEEFHTRACGNHCVFCFTDQNPKGLRKSLYFKDEDYRLSFLYGHYTTLTNTSQRDLDRIVEQQLSPLYISVHATDCEVRKFLFGLKRPDNLLEKLSFLTDHHIQLHTQIVLCPGVNDREYLDRTISDLADFYPGVVSIAVVPLGLTKHRDRLVKLRPVTSEDAKIVLKQVTKHQLILKKKIGTKFVFPGDELFLSAGEKIPPAAYYEDYPQIEDGVGMIRYLLESFSETEKDLPKSVKQSPISLLSGVSAAPILRKEILPVLRRIDGLEVNVIPVKNRFFGESISVSGLLSGQDFAQAISENNVKGVVLIPSKCLNRDLLFLDDWTVDKLERETDCSVAFMDDFLEGLPDFMRSL